MMNDTARSALINGSRILYTFSEYGTDDVEFLNGNLRLVIKILEEVIATNGNPSEGIIDDIRNRGKELSIDSAIRSGNFNDMTRAEVEELMEKISKEIIS